MMAAAVGVVGTLPRTRFSRASSPQERRRLISVITVRQGALVARALPGPEYSRNIPAMPQCRHPPGLAQ